MMGSICTYEIQIKKVYFIGYKCTYVYKYFDICLNSLNLSKLIIELGILLELHESYKSY